MPAVSTRVAFFAALVLAPGVFGTKYPDCVNGPLRNNTVCNRNATPTERAAALVAAMRIEEKLVNFVE